MRIIGSHLVFEHDAPDYIKGLIPTTKVSGKWCAVPHTIQASSILNNIGLADVPSPITKDFDWPGKFTPFAHQIKTAEFFTLNRRSYCLSGLGCISGEGVLSANRCGKTFKITMRDLYKRWNNPRYNSLGNQEWKCRSLMGDRYGLNQIENVIYKGEQDTILITLEDGKILRCTSDHHLAQPDGTWIEAGEIKVGDHLVTNGKEMINIPCPLCGADRFVKPERKWHAPKQTCMDCRKRKLSERMRGENNPFWEGGKPFIDSDGYVQIFMPEHPRSGSDNRVYEHIVIAEKYFGIEITSETHVHHKNGVKCDNRPENLELMSSRDHHRSHDPLMKLHEGKTINGGTVVIIPDRSRVVSVAPGGVTDVYDLTMKAPHHNYVVNGIVVHNSGKTMSVLWAAEYLKRKGLVNRVLIVSPLSTLEVVWGREIFVNLVGRKYVVLHGTRQKRTELLNTKADFYIINHHGVDIMKHALNERPDIDLIIFDEISCARSSKTTRWRAFHSIITPSRWVWGLTGSPTPQAPTDAYGISKLITPERVPFSFARFKQETMIQVSPFKWVPRRNAEQVVARVLQPSIRFALRDCVDLPPTIVQYREVPMTAEQTTHYNKLLKECITEIRDVQVTAVNAAVLLGKLIQATCGILYGPDGEILKLDYAHRFNEIVDIIEECDEKVIVFCHLTGVVEALYRDLGKKFKTELIHGGVSPHKRKEVFDAIQHSDSRVLVANAEAMSHGITLTAASTIVWFAPCTKAEVYEQANGRIVRPGQKNVTNIINLMSVKEEKKIYEGLEGKKKFADAVLDIVRGR